MANNRRVVQGQDWFLAGSGCTLSATSITLTAMTLPGNETLVTTAMIGDIGYMTLEPETEREENISFTGITQNANGTATLTGVTRGLNFVHPYTADASLRQAHAGGSLCRMSNSVQLYDSQAFKENDETINGAWTFSDEVTIPITPLASTDAASKNYVDTVVTTVGGITAFLVSQNGALAVDVGSGEWMFNDTPTLFAGATAQAVVAASTNFVELTASNTVSVNQTAFTAGRLPLAIVTTGVSSISSIVDRRAWLTNASQQQPITATFTYGGTIAAGEPVYLDSADGKVKKALATAAATADSFIGIALDAGVNNDTGKRVQTGGTITTLSGMTPGFVFLSDTGTLSATPGTYRRLIGFAGTATKMVLMPGSLATAITGANSDTTTANFNEAMTFFAGTAITAANANTLIGGASSDASSLHTHLAMLSPITLGALSAADGQDASPVGTGFSDATTKLVAVAAHAGGAVDDLLTEVYERGISPMTAALGSHGPVTATGGLQSITGVIGIGSDIWASDVSDTKIYKNGTAVTISGTNRFGPLGHNPTASTLLILYSTTKIAVFTGIAGTTITNANTDITLDNPVDYFLWDNTNSRVIGIDNSAKLVRRFNSAGTTIDSVAIPFVTSSNYGVAILGGRVYVVTGSKVISIGSSTETTVTYILNPTTMIVS